jgi:hypothetical protein
MHTNLRYENRKRSKGALEFSSKKVSKLSSNKELINNQTLKQKAFKTKMHSHKDVTKSQPPQGQ